MSRRSASKLLLALPVAGSALSQQKTEATKPEERPTPEAEFIAAREGSLSETEREALKKNITGFEKSLTVIREFKLPAEVAPAVRFAPLRSRRR